MQVMWSIKMAASNTHMTDGERKQRYHKLDLNNDSVLCFIDEWS